MDLRTRSHRFRAPHFSLTPWILAALLGLQARLLPAVDGLDDSPGALTYVAFDLQSPGTDQALDGVGNIFTDGFESGYTFFWK